MKKILTSIVLAVMVLIGYSVIAHADSMDASVPLTFSVAEQFGFVLDKYSHDFGAITTGGGAETTITASCRSNHGIVWRLRVQAANFQNGSGDTLSSDPGEVFDPSGDTVNTGFSMAVWGPAAGDDNELKGTVNYPYGWVPAATPYDIYTSSIEEGADDYVPVTMGLYLTLPGALASGMYSTDFVLTMYE